MRVWRVEHSTLNYGKFGETWPAGPYCGPAGVADLRWSHNDDRHPGPGRDRILQWISQNELCGLDSREALDAWFMNWHQRLEEAGFVVSVYEVPDECARVGEYGQVCFMYREATRIGAEFWEIAA